MKMNFIRKALAIVWISLTICGAANALWFGDQNGSEAAREAFWEKFKAAVIKKDKASVAALSQFPISMPYGMRTVRNRAQLIQRYRDVFNHEGDAAVCFAEAKPQTDPARPKEFTVGCKNSAGDEVVIYSFVLTRTGWRFNGLDNLNE